MGEQKLTEFLSHLARDVHVAASTQNQALSALLFLYKRGAQAAVATCHMKSLGDLKGLPKKFQIFVL